MERMSALDIPEKQVAIDFFDNPNGFRWHARVLLIRLGLGKWILATPDLEVQFKDLATSVDLVFEADPWQRGRDLVECLSKRNNTQEALDAFAIAFSKDSSLQLPSDTDQMFAAFKQKFDG